MATTRVIVVADHTVVRRGLCALLSAQSFDCVADVGTGREALERAASTFSPIPRISPGHLQEVRFRAERPGRFVMFCTIPCGRAHPRMQATLVVT